MPKKKIKKHSKKEAKQTVKNKLTKKEPLINKDYIKVCPNCGSKNVEYYTDDYRRQYRCLKCSYFANEFPEIKKSEYKQDSEKIKKSIAEHKLRQKAKPLWETICGLLIFAFLIFVAIIVLFGAFNFGSLIAVLIATLIALITTIIIYYFYLRK